MTATPSSPSSRPAPSTAPRSRPTEPSPPSADVPGAAPDGVPTSPGPVDREWPRHERAARAEAGDDEDTEEPYGDPASVRDEGVLESLGKSISSPVIDAERNTDTGKRS